MLLNGPCGTHRATLTPAVGLQLKSRQNTIALASSSVRAMSMSPGLAAVGGFTTSGSVARIFHGAVLMLMSPCTGSRSSLRSVGVPATAAARPLLETPGRCSNTHGAAGGCAVVVAALQM